MFVPIFGFGSSNELHSHLRSLLLVEQTAHPQISFLNDFYNNFQDIILQVYSVAQEINILCQSHLTLGRRKNNQGPWSHIVSMKCMELTIINDVCVAS